MSENMEGFRSLDGSDARIRSDYIDIVFQHGNPEEVGINGCRLEDVIDHLIRKLLDFQGRALACEENAEALNHLELASQALVKRRRRREMQGVLGTRDIHIADAAATRSTSS